MHIVEFVHICILSGTYNRKHARTHAHTHARTHTDTHAHTYTHTHTHTRTRAHARTHASTHTHTYTQVNMFILTNKRSSIYIQTVFSLACLLYCKGGNLYCTRVVPLYLFYVFVSMLSFLYVYVDLYAFLFSPLNNVCTCSVMCS